MPNVPLHIPQIGEGLQEARLVAVLKQPGDRVKRDEPIYQMETDKAVMDVESPYEGVIIQWLVPVDTLLPIGAPVGMMDVVDGTSLNEPSHGAPSADSAPPANASGTQIIDLNIPQIGEGLQEARLVATLKNPGDKIKRDEPIYQMETDKAVMDVESPHEGVLTEWLVSVDTVLPIGAPVGRMEVGSHVSAAPSAHHVPVATTVAAPTSSVGSSAGQRRTDIPPRTRAYAKQKGVSDDVLNLIQGKGSKLMPEDIDAYLAGGSASPVSAPAATVASAGPKSGVSSSGSSYNEEALSQKQRLLSSRLQRGSQLVVPGTITVQVVWDHIESARAGFKTSGGDFQPSAFTMFAYAVTLAIRDFAGFRSTLTTDSILRTYDHVQLGIAVALPGDELVLAVVPDADKLAWKEFADSARNQINEARAGKDQANEAVTVSLTNMQAFGLRDAVPVVVPPSIATIFLGEAYKALDQTSDDLKLIRVVNVAMTFDHRLINGVGASEFIARIKQNVENIKDLIK